ncbi:DUF1028 domain-containing protein [Roseateles sp.]|uniref:DUF1028 domain-containing protein n=1 Tax=Roseateles sp. TaxID=1971397 RepID=UPI0039E81A95
MKMWIGVTVLVGFMAMAAPASATFSIVACDAQGSCGAAVATHNLAVGATVIHAQARVGAIASQFETHPRHGLRGLALLAAGRTASATIDVLLSEDGNFDGQDQHWRQIAVVGTSGDGAAFTGRQAGASIWAGSTSGPGLSVQGNGLVGEEVTAAMRETFLRVRGALAERLMAALEAGQNAGGQKIGTMSAALLVRTPEGEWNDVDLRVDAASDPVLALRRLLNLRRAHDAVLLAERQQRRGKFPEARAAVAEAMRLAGDWDRVLRRIARLSMAMDDKELALRALTAFTQLNPAWASTETRDEIYRPLFLMPAFQALPTSVASPARGG